MAFSFRRYYAHPEVYPLCVIILGLLLSLTFFLNQAAPFWISVILAYLLQYPIAYINRFYSYKASTIIVFFSTLSFLSIVLWISVPFLYLEATLLVENFPEFIGAVYLSIEKASPFPISNLDHQTALSMLHEKNHAIFSQIAHFLLIHTPSAIHLLIYLVTIPVMIFFMSYDKHFFLERAVAILPQPCCVLKKIALESATQIDYYVKGKVVHMLAIGLISYLLLWFFGVHFAVLLSIPMGLSVFIPFVGNALATIPLLIIAYAQFGLTWKLGYLLMGYIGIQIWETNMLVPMIFAHSNDLHPVTILGSVLIFGALWGITGVLFAIPIVTTGRVIVANWPIYDN